MLETDELQDTAPDGTAPALDLTVDHLEAIRDEWLEPVLLQLRHQAEEVGRLEAHVQHLQDERERLIAACNDLRADLAARAEEEPPQDSANADLVANLVAQLRTSEGAVIVGIVIAMGLWLGIGILAWSLLG